jgi:hypothetical protein
MATEKTIEFRDGGIVFTFTRDGDLEVEVGDCSVGGSGRCKSMSAEDVRELISFLSDGAK